LAEARASLQFIAKFNGVPLNFNEEDFTLPNDGSDEKIKTPPLSFWLRQPKILTNLIVMTIVWLTASFNFYLIAFLLTSFD